IKDAYIYGCDSIMLDLEDAVAENQKDAARFSLYHALKTIDYGDTEVIVRINGLDTPHWQEDVRVCVAGGADGIRIAKCESAQDVLTVERAVEAAEEEFGVEKGRTLLMAALESPKGILNAYEICAASDRMFGVAISGGDFRKCMQTVPQPDGVDMLAARGQMLLAARAAGIQCFDTVFTNLDDEEGFRAEVLQNKAMGFDGKSLINPKQIRLCTSFRPDREEVARRSHGHPPPRAAAAGVGVFTVNGKMVDVAFIPGAERTLKLARPAACTRGIWHEKRSWTRYPGVPPERQGRSIRAKTTWTASICRKPPRTRRYERPQESKIVGRWPTRCASAARRTA
ncbi:MAG: aldolase/citrate lyase family protein, partial [Flavonifractor plautii]